MQKTTTSWTRASLHQGKSFVPPKLEIGGTALDRTRRLEAGIVCAVKRKD
mgnify:CR=1 FL=1